MAAPLNHIAQQALCVITMDRSDTTECPSCRGPTPGVRWHSQATGLIVGIPGHFSPSWRSFRTSQDSFKQTTESTEAHLPETGAVSSSLPLDGLIQRRLLGLLQHLDQTPALALAEWTGLHQTNAVPDTGGLLLVTGLRLAGGADDLAV